MSLRFSIIEIEMAWRGAVHGTTRAWKHGNSYTQTTLFAGGGGFSFCLLLRPVISLLFPFFFLRKLLKVEYVVIPRLILFVSGKIILHMFNLRYLHFQVQTRYLWFHPQIK